MGAISKEANALRLDFLDKFETGQRLKIKFQLDAVIDHPLYGSSPKLAGEYILFSKAGGYTISKYFELSRKQQERLLDDTVSRMREMYRRYNDDECRKVCFQNLLICAVTMPSLVGRGFECGIDSVCVAFDTDDTLEEHGVHSDIPNVYRKLYKEIQKPKYEKFKSQFKGQHWTQCLTLKNNKIGLLTEKEKEKWKANIIQSVPEYEPLLPAAKQLIKKMKQEFPEGLPTYTKEILALVLNTTEAVMFANKGPGPYRMSEKALATLRGYDTGFGAILEICCLFQRINVPKPIRITLLFQMLQTASREFSGISNDILGLPRDIREEATNKNVILRRVVREKISIEQAFNETMKSLQETISDLNLLVKVLEGGFPGEKNLGAYIQTVKDLADGQSIGYVLGSIQNLRYGRVPVTLEVAEEETETDDEEE